MKHYKLWICNRCGDNAECEPGELCEVCSEGTIRVVDVVPVERSRDDPERWDAVVANAIEAEFRRWMPTLKQERVRAVAVLAAQRARFDLADVDRSVREIREAADA